jgi:hypothetical protein
MTEEAQTAPGEAHQSGSNIVRLIIAWLWVGVPLIWGVSLTIITSLALFK